MLVPVCVFAKPPVPGRVKTRLAADVGDVAAARVATALLQDAWDAVLATPGALAVLATTGAGDFGVDAPHPWLQSGDDLGGKVWSILDRGVREYGAAIAVGGDTAALTPSRLAAAIDALRIHDAVLGPSDDGGFWCLGLRACPVGLLDDLPWSEPNTCAETRRRLVDRLGGVGDLARGYDVDDLPSLARLVTDADAGRIAEGHASRLGRRLLP